MNSLPLVGSVAVLLICFAPARDSAEAQIVPDPGHTFTLHERMAVERLHQIYFAQRA